MFKQIPLLKPAFRNPSSIAKQIRASAGVSFHLTGGEINSQRVGKGENKDFHGGAFLLPRVLALQQVEGSFTLIKLDMENQKHTGLLTRYVLDLNLNRSLFFSLGTDCAEPSRELCMLFQASS